MVLATLTAFFFLFFFFNDHSVSQFRCSTSADSGYLEAPGTPRAADDTSTVVGISLDTIPEDLWTPLSTNQSIQFYSKTAANVYFKGNRWKV